MPAISFIEWCNISTFHDTRKKGINFVRRYLDIMEKIGHFSQKSGKRWTYWKNWTFFSKEWKRVDKEWKKVVILEKLDILLKRVEKSGHSSLFYVDFAVIQILKSIFEGNIYSEKGVLLFLRASNKI